MIFLDKDRVTTENYFLALLTTLKENCGVEKKWKVAQRSPNRILTIRVLGFELFRHPSYSPILALSNYHVLPQLQVERSYIFCQRRGVEVWFAEQDNFFFYKV